MQWHGLLSGKAYQLEPYTRGACFFIFIFYGKDYQSGHPARQPSTLEQDDLQVSIFTFILSGPSLPIWTSCQAALHSWSRMTSMYLYSLIKAYKSGRLARRPSGAGWPPFFFLNINTLWLKLTNLDVLPGGPPLLEQDDLHVPLRHLHQAAVPVRQVHQRQGQVVLKIKNILCSIENDATPTFYAA